jgi:hypothetical protein
MIALHRSDDAPEHSVLRSGLHCEDRADDKARHQYIFSLQKMHNFRTPTYLRRDSSTDTFAAAINAQQMGTLAANAQHKGVPASIDPVVLIGDSTLQRRYLCLCRVPSRKLCENALDVWLQHRSLLALVPEQPLAEHTQ